MAGERPDAADSETDSSRVARSGATDDPAVSTDGGESVTVQVPDDLGAWLEDQVADDPDRDRGDVLRDLAAAYRQVDTDGDAVPAPVDERLDAQREEYVELVEDVRERVVEVAREMDDLAPADHDHPDLPDEDRVESLAADLADLESTVEDGFENYETVLEELTEAVDELSERMDTLAARVVDRGGGEAVRDLRRTANQAGVRTATCEDCGASVDVGLLTDPECPHCRSQFVDVDADSGILGSPTLLVGSPPALAGPEEGDPDE